MSAPVSEAPHYKTVSLIGQSIVITILLVFLVFEFKNKVKNPMKWDTALKYTISACVLMILQQIFSIATILTKDPAKYASFVLNQTCIVVYLAIQTLWMLSVLYRYDRIMMIIPGSLHSWIVSLTRLFTIVAICAALIVFLILNKQVMTLEDDALVNTIMTAITVLLLLIDLTTAIIMSLRVVNSLKAKYNSRNQLAIDNPILKDRNKRLKAIEFSIILGVILIIIMDVGGVVSILVFHLDTIAISIAFVHILVTFHLLSMLRSGIEFIEANTRAPDPITQLSSVILNSMDEN